MNKAVFIDKDGTLIKDIPYNVDVRKVALENGVPYALKLLKEYNFLLVIISNQSGVAQGFFSEGDLEKVNIKIQGDLLPFLVQIDAFYYCPHLPGGIVSEYAIECNCRKPKPGLISRAAKELDINVQQSWMIGDILNDAEAGNKAGCKSILVDNGNETEWLKGENRTPDFKVKHLGEAAAIIVEQQRKTTNRYDKHLA